MKQSIQNKIEAFTKLAKSQHLVSNSPANVSSREDSLLKAIRNKGEADLFIAELEAVIKISQRNNK